MTIDHATRRLVDQRVRNRMMEALLCLADGDAEVERFGAHEWFEGFYDFAGSGGPGVHDNSALNADEWAAIDAVQSLGSTRPPNIPAKDGRANTTL